MFDGVTIGAERRLGCTMIPLHLTSTTIHVTAEQAERLIAAAVAEWLPGVRALLTRSGDDAEVLSALTA